MIGIIAALGNDIHTVKYAVYQEELKTGDRCPYSCRVFVRDIQEPTEDEISLYKKYLIKFGYIYSNGNVIKDEEF